jgi:hypothetical protein
MLISEDVKYSKDTIPDHIVIDKDYNGYSKRLTSNHGEGVRLVLMDRVFIKFFHFFLFFT